MNIISWLGNLGTVTETDILPIVTKAKKIVLNVESDITLFAHEVHAFFGWLASEVPNIIAFSQQVANVAAAAGAIVPSIAPEATAVVAAANLEIAALSKFQASYNANGGAASDVVAAYAAITSARSASNKAMSIVVSAPVTPAAPTASQAPATS